MSKQAVINSGGNAQGTDAPIEKGTGATLRQQLMEKYANKSKEDLAEMHENAQGQVNKQANEIGDLRKANEDLKNQLLGFTNPQQAQSETNGTDQGNSNDTVGDDLSIIPPSQQQQAQAQQSDSMNQDGDIARLKEDSDNYKRLLMEKAVTEVAGSLENYKKIVAHSVDSMSEAEAEAFNTMLKSGNTALMQRVLKGMKAEYELANGTLGKPNLIRGDAVSNNGTNLKFPTPQAYNQFIMSAEFKKMNTEQMLKVYQEKKRCEKFWN